MTAAGNRDQQVETRRSAYDHDEKDYTDRRYRKGALRQYAQVRTDEICHVLGRELPTLEGLRLLDVGCGTGLQLKQLAERLPGARLHGMDFSAKMLEDARAALSREGLEVDLRQASAFDQPYESDTFDAVVATRFIHQYTDDLKRNLIQEMTRVAKPGGVVVVEFYSFFTWLIRYPMKFGKPLADHFKHSPTRRAVSRIVGRPFRVVPLMPPGITYLEMLGGPRLVQLLRKLLLVSRLDFAFDQYLVYFTKQ